MKVTYYPGCSLEGTARDYADSIHGVCQCMGIRLEEVPDWNCCGATAAHSVNRKAAVELAARNLNLAAGMSNMNMLVPCPLCFNRLKTAEHELKGEGAHRFEVKLDGRVPLVWDLANFFATEDMLPRVRNKVVKKLEGLRVVAYYGCMANRPPEVTGAADHENPQSIDRILTALGATAIQWPFKTDCCGASLMISRPDMGRRMVGKLFDMARRMEAQAIVVSCQMCQSNLDMYQGQVESAWGRKLALPVIYFTELMGLAWGMPDAGEWLGRHFADPRPVLREAGLLT